jgi:predicted dehydrogenase
MVNAVRVGIIGLGRRWQRYKAALLALRDRLPIRAICDEVPQRAAYEARALNCLATAGPTELLERGDVDAVLLLDAQWYRLWPVELACGYSKPMFCCPSLACDDAHADAICQKVRDKALPVMVELAPRQARATRQLRWLLETALGPARLLLANFGQTGARPTLVSSAGLGVVDWCVLLMGNEPVGARMVEEEGLPFANLLLDFGGGRSAQITSWRSQGKPGLSRRAPRLQAIAERGMATVELPDRIEWIDAEGRHAQIGKHSSLEREQLEQFHEALTIGEPPQPSLEEAYRALNWLRVAQQRCAD